MSHILRSYWLGPQLSCVLSIAACAATSENAPPPEHAKNPGAPCSYIGVDANSAPIHDDVDSASLVAVYRMPESRAKTTDPVELKASVHQSNMDEQRGTLEANPDVICRPVSEQPAQPEPSPVQ